ncbi:MAG: hypothetical protein PWQ37_2156 [Candidatus Petromonas sp.]|jgi:ABC-type transporter Mla subunit MlaD|nr:hypothetical protein [Candidatus Petromonas sp.]
MIKFVGKDLLEAFVKISPYINELTYSDNFIAVADTEKYIAYTPAKGLKLNVKVGTRVKEGSTADLAMKNGKKTVLNISKEVYGLPFKAIAEPIYDEDGKIIGAVLIGTSTDNEEKLKNTVDNFAESFEYVNKTIQEISLAASNLAEISEKLAEMVVETQIKVKKSDEIIGMIKHLASQTKLLGLNAAIEAARAGDYGRGFAIVANEIHRLSEQSNDSVENVSSILDEMIENIEEINKSSQETSAVCQQQASASQEIAATIDELAKRLDELKEFSDII